MEARLAKLVSFEQNMEYLGHEKKQGIPKKHGKEDQGSGCDFLQSSGVAPANRFASQFANVGCFWQFGVFLLEQQGEFTKIGAVREFGVLVNFPCFSKEKKTPNPRKHPKSANRFANASSDFCKSHSRTLTLEHQVNSGVYQKHARALMRTLAKFGELWRTHNVMFRTSSLTFTRVPAKVAQVHQSSSEGAFCMRVAFGMWPSEQWFGGHAATEDEFRMPHNMSF